MKTEIDRKIINCWLFFFLVDIPAKKWKKKKTLAAVEPTCMTFRIIATFDECNDLFDCYSPYLLNEQIILI